MAGSSVRKHAANADHAMQEPQSQDCALWEAHVEDKWPGSGSSAMLSYWLGAAAWGEHSISTNAEHILGGSGWGRQPTAWTSVRHLPP